ncbi:hypothetical protein HNP72_003519 [Sphingobacterium soli]|nr:hypothetical protein [Sphingobacterium soli]
MLILLFIGLSWLVFIKLLRKKDFLLQITISCGIEFKGINA